MSNRPDFEMAHAFECAQRAAKVLEAEDPMGQNVEVSAQWLRQAQFWLDVARFDQDRAIQ